MESACGDDRPGCRAAGRWTSRSWDQAVPADQRSRQAAARRTQDGQQLGHARQAALRAHPRRPSPLSHQPDPGAGPLPHQHPAARPANPGASWQCRADCPMTRPIHDADAAVGIDTTGRARRGGQKLLLLPHRGVAGGNSGQPPGRRASPAALDHLRPRSATAPGTTGDRRMPRSPDRIPTTQPPGELVLAASQPLRVALLAPPTTTMSPSSLELGQVRWLAEGLAARGHLVTLVGAGLAGVAATGVYAVIDIDPTGGQRASAEIVVRLHAEQAGKALERLGEVEVVGDHTRTGWLPSGGASLHPRTVQTSYRPLVGRLEPAPQGCRAPGMGGGLRPPATHGADHALGGEDPPGHPDRRAQAVLYTHRAVRVPGAADQTP